MTVEIREYAEKDLPFLVELLNETYKHDYEFCPFNGERLGSWIRRPQFRILIAEKRGRIVGSAAYHDSHWGEEIEWMAVPEGPHRKTLEDTFVSRLEEFAKSGKIFRAMDSDSPKISEWVHRGYRVEGGLYHMIAAVDRARPLPAVPEGVSLRSLRPTEENEFVKAVNAGFEKERVKLGDIQLWKTDNPPFDGEWIHVAETGGRIVSVVVAKPDTQYNRFFKANRGYLGPAATLPDYRSKNLASALTVRAMNGLFLKRMDSVALYTSETNAASIALLLKIGFVTGHHWKFLQKALPQQDLKN